MLKFKQIYVCGDLHGRFIPFCEILDEIPEKSLIIQVGDWSFGFRTFAEDKYILEQINKELIPQKSKLFILSGNHDYRVYFENDPFQLSNIQLLKDYTKLTINNKKFLFVGGAISVDRFGRTEDKDWWPEETLKKVDLNKLSPCDILILHSAPDFVYPVGYDAPIVIGWAKHDKKLIDDLKDEREYLTKLVKKVKPKECIYGHFHTSNTEVIDGCKYVLLNELEMKEINL